jgi:predicted Zn-dependent peptidase
MKKSFLPAILLLIFVPGGRAAAQNMPEPYQEKLLNGLKVLVWNDPKADKVTLKLRIHAGSAFDPKDKMGVMALLSDILFPDPQTYEYFKDDLEGSLEVSGNYDYIQITATGKADEFINILDTIRVGVVTTPINQENFVKVRDARLAKAREEAAKPGVIADGAAAKRLLSDFPYGRAMNGTPESIAKIDRFDLVTAREKFLDADNATLAVTGKIDPRFAVKAAKQLLGNWQKSDAIIPATFAQPAEADTRTLIVDQPGAESAEVRFAVRGLAVNDKDVPAASFWASAFEKKINAALPSECAPGVKVSNTAHLLPGIFEVSGAFPVEAAGKCFDAVKNIVAKADTDKVKPGDFTEIQKNVLQVMNDMASDLDRVSELWLSADTFKWGKVSDRIKQMNAALPADGDKVAARLFWKSPVVSVIVGDAAKIKPQLETVPAAPATKP